MGDTSETNTKVLSREFFFRCGSTKNADKEKSLFARHGPFSQVLSHMYVIYKSWLLVVFSSVNINHKIPPTSVSDTVFVTGSGKRDIFAQTMIFQYKRCCSKKLNIIYYSKKFFFWLNGIYNSLPTLTPNFSKLNALLTGQARCLKTAT